MPNNYYVCNTTKVKATNAGGRLHSAVLEKEVPNGALVFVGDLKENEREIREANIPETADITGSVRPMLVMKPEINPDQCRRSNAALGKHRNPANKPVPVIPLEIYDEFELSEDFFTGKTPEEIKVGQIYKMTDQAFTYEFENDNSAAGIADNVCYLRVTGVRDAYMPTTLAGDDLKIKFPVTYKMVTVEVKFNK